MDPKAIMEGIKVVSGAAGAVKESAGAFGSIAKVVETFQDGKVRRTGKYVEIVEGAVGSLASVGKTVSQICESQRNNKAATSKIYSEIAASQKEIDSKIEKARNEMMNKDRLTTAQIKDMSEKNDIARKKMSLDHEEEMKKIENQHQREMDSNELLKQKEDNRFAVEMKKLEMEKERVDAEIRNMDAQTSEIIERTEERRRYADFILRCLEEELNLLLRIQQDSDLSPTILSELSNRRMILLGECKKLQALPVLSEE